MRDDGDIDFDQLEESAGSRLGDWDALLDAIHTHCPQSIEQSFERARPLLEVDPFLAEAYRKSSLAQSPYSLTCILEWARNRSRFEPGWLLCDRLSDPTDSELTLSYAWRGAVLETLKIVGARYDVLGSVLWPKKEGAAFRTKVMKAALDKVRAYGLSGQIEADDIMNEVTRRLLEREDRYLRPYLAMEFLGAEGWRGEGEWRLMAWIGQKVIDIAVDELRRVLRKRRAEGQLEYQTAGWSDDADAFQIEDESARAKSAVIRLTRAINHLTEEKDRTLAWEYIKLQYLFQEDDRYARSTGCHPPTIDHCSRRRLKSLTLIEAADQLEVAQSDLDRVVRKLKKILRRSWPDHWIVRRKRRRARRQAR